jgi:hypothetical protein
MSQSIKSVILTIVSSLLVTSIITTAQVRRYEFGGLNYTFPSVQGVGSLTNSGTGTLAWSSTNTPSGLVAFTVTGVCPSGWIEYTVARGRYMISTPFGGFAGNVIGGPLTNLENRDVPYHTHTASLNAVLYDPGHSHILNDPGHVHGDLTIAGGNGNGVLEVPVISGVVRSGTSVTGVTTNNTSLSFSISTSVGVTRYFSEPGTTAPYIQLMTCLKS